MKTTRNGGTMEATYIPVQVVEAPVSNVRLWDATKSAFRVLGRVLVESAKGDDFDRAFSSPSDAQFAALPHGQQNRLLDRGFRS
ncbi:MAG: hypothetical protein OEW47_05520 [Thermoleophilia bacterium]|nr:hypothetical protein [Thermoleophilia bacterium]